MVVDYDSLLSHVLSGHIAGAAVDVFPVEPKAQGDAFESVLRGLDNVILTPHVGGSTQEAQEEIGWFVAEKLAGFAREGSTALSVNLPQVLPPPLPAGHRLGFLHHNVPGVLADLNAVFAAAGDNVIGQHMSTRDHLGYAITDASEPLSDEAIEGLRRSEHCLWVRTW
jgi:D-3-phosphoglycerate dehydrogenase